MPQGYTEDELDEEISHYEITNGDGGPYIMVINVDTAEIIIGGF